MVAITRYCIQCRVLQGNSVDLQLSQAMLPTELEKGTLDTAIAASKVMIRLMQASGARLCTWEPLLWRNTVKLTRRLVDPTAVMPPAW